MNENIKILRVLEKNCYEHGNECIHKCIYIDSQGKIQSTLMTSNEIRKRLGKDCPDHFYDIMANDAIGH